MPSPGPNTPPPPEAVPLIPRQVLFGNPRRLSPQLSPDGEYLAYLAPDDRDVLQVWLRTPGREDDRVITADRKRGIRMFLWTYDGRQLAYLQDSDGDEDWHVYAVDVRTSVVRDLTPFQGITAEIIGVEPAVPGQMLVGLNLRDRRAHDVYRVDLRNGAVEPDSENPGTFVAWEADAELQVRAALASRPDGGSDLMVRDAPGGPWRRLMEWGPDDSGGPLTFSRDGGTLHVLTTRDANATRLLAVSLADGGWTVVAEDPRYDVGGTFIHPRTHEVQAVGFYRDTLQWQVLDASLAADFEALGRLGRGEFRILGGDLDDRRWIVVRNLDDGPMHYYLYDRASKSAGLLFVNNPLLTGLPLARMRPVFFAARDGLELHGYHTPPTWAPQGDDRAPTVLLVHGGPWGRDTWGYNPMVQWLANRGYAVLQVNFRGSAGYGKAFLNAGNREWAGKMHDDLIDAVGWLVEQGGADPRRIGILGGSYGGYATLVGLTFTPEAFACGVDLVGPSNLLTLLRNFPPYWQPFMSIIHHRVGDPDRDEEFLRSRSPLFLAERIRRPLLIGQGANDPRVKQSESDQVARAMRQAGLPVEYLVYADEGHGFARPANRLHFFARAERFLARHLGGRAEPVGEVAGHSAAEM